MVQSVPQNGSQESLPCGSTQGSGGGSSSRGWVQAGSVDQSILYIPLHITKLHGRQHYYITPYT